ncbi:OmpA family protein [Campylobacter rectus]
MKTRSEGKSGDQTFWISYADLMAGLMFVFMLIIGAVVVKYVLSQSDLAKLQKDLSEREKQIASSQNELVRKENVIKEIFSNLDRAKSENKELADINRLVNEMLEGVKKEKNELTNLTQTYEINLNDANKTIADLQDRVLQLGQILAQRDETLKDVNATLAQKEDVIRVLNEKFNSEISRYLALEEDFNKTKDKIKDLSSLRSNVISNLRAKLGGKVNIDPSSGVVSLPESILFDTGSYELKDEAKARLKEILQTYFEAILNSEEIIKHIDRIVIEGHTNSVGSYMYNLDLSQKRAYSVLDFIYSWNKDKRLERYLIASGRSFSDLVIKNGKEDPDASRRIEIKISISDKESMREMENFLEQQNKKYSKN